MAPPIPITEDTPPDMLAGSMDLSVVLPSGHALKMSLERSTPMMDLLVQVTTANKMSPAGYIIQPLNEHGPLPYKPSTPIGALDAWTIRIVPKQNVHCTTDKKHLKMLNQPFEQTFRLQVHLPRNQLYVARVSPRTRLSDILLQVCSEKNLDPIKYSLRHPSNLDQVLKLSCTLQDYKLQEVTLVCNKSHPVEVSSVDIMSLQRDATNPAYRSTMCDEGSVSSGSLEGRSLSPAPSDGSSASPPPLPPSRPIRKRRPAPKPPALIKKISDEKLQNGVQSSTVIYHSRNSSDSSGYHEASVLSESPQNNSVTETLTRRKMASVSESKSMTDVTVIEPSLQQATSYNSITSLSSVPGRKKKTAAPPPPVPNSRTSSVTEDQQRTPSVSSTASSTTTLDGNEVKVAVKSATLPPSSRLNSVSSPPPSPSLAATVKPPSNTPQVDPAPRPRSKLLDSELHTQLTSILKDMPSSPKENFAPQPKPRKLLSTSQSFEENRDGIHNTQETSSPEETKSPKHLEFMNRKLHYSVFKTHKACIDELAFKFERTDSMIEIENTSTSGDTTESPVAVECQPPGNQTSHSPTTLVTESNTDSDADNSEIRMADEEIDRIFINATKSHSSHQLEEEQIMSLSSLPSPPSSLIQNESIQPPNNENLDWEYRLPAPPTFRDESKSPIVTEFGTITIGNLNDMLLPDTIKEDNLDKPEITSLKENGVQDNTDLNKTNNINEPLVETSRSSLVQEIIVEPTDPGDQHIVIESVEQNVINELSNFIQRPNKSDTTDVESKCLSQEKSSSSTLDNFTITTYKDTKPVEVFEDESVKSSVGEKRDKSKDDAVFRAPKPRVKEPNLSRTSSFSMENKLNGPLIKRSMSYVSLLAANMPRHSQPYQALLGQQHWPPLRKTSSEINIDNKDGLPGESSFCQDNPAELQSVQVLRNILSQSHATLTPSPETESNIRSRDPSNSLQKSEDTVDSDVGSNKLRRSQSDEKPVEWNPTSKMLHTASLDEEYPRSLGQRGVPNINLSTWNERPKRQISIKHDADYTSGFGKKLVNQDEMSIDDQQNANVIIPIKLESPLKNLEQMEVKNLDKNFKLEGRSKSVSDLSRIPVVRAVEFKKPFATQSFDQSLLKPVHLVDNIRRNNVTQPETPTLLEQESNSDNTFIGVNSLARKFGAPQKRPVSVYGTSYSRIKNMQSDSKESTKPPKNTFDSKGDFSVVVAKKTNDKSEDSDEAKTVEQHSNLKLNLVTSEIKAQARQSSGGFLGKESSLFTPSTQVTQADQIPGGSLTFDAPKNVETVSQVDTLFNSVENQNKHVSNIKTSTNANIPAPLSPTQKVATTGIYRQSQTLNRQTRPISLQPVVKGFRVSTETPNSTRDKLSSFPPNAKDSKTMPIVINSVTNPVSSAQKKTYHRALSTPAILLSSVNIIDSAKERNQNKTSTVPSTPTSVTRDAIPAPPPPLLMHTLKPIGSRNVKLLPPPVAKPRDQLMLSIRSFNIDKLKPVSTQTKSSNSDKDLI